MPNRRLSVPMAVCAAVLLAACGVESPTGSVLTPGSAVAAKQPGSCTFTTPNGKTHSVPAKSARCRAPAVGQVAGTYDLTRFTFRQLERVDGGETRVISDLYDVVDFLGEGGGEFTLTLNPDGTTSGRFFVPPNPGEEGSGLDLDLAGSWRLDGDTVALETDTFLDELSFTYADGRLTAGEATIGDADDPLFVEEVILTRR